MKWEYQEKRLKYICILLTSDERYSVSETEKWMECIQVSGITCILKYTDNLSGQTGRQTGSLECFLLEYHPDDTMVLTDSREISELGAQNGYVCIGLDPFMEYFFNGAEAVVSSFADLDSIYMEETFLRAKGFPVLIMETERVRIREIIKEDIPVLYEISRQEGMEYAFADQEQADCFGCARMRAYISNVYRFYGYGLWTVETLQGEIIGCCGLSDVVVNDNPADELTENECMVLYMPDHMYEGEEFDKKSFMEEDTENVASGSWLELQYFVANRFQHQGYGTEMCRAVIKYAQERLQEYELCVRIHPENTVSVRLAKKLGFQ